MSMEATQTTNSSAIENTSKTVNNGVNGAALVESREALTNMPQAAQFTWKAECDWVNGTHCRTSINKFFGLGEVHERSKTFVIDADHPEVFAAEDKGATPIEFVLVALSSCLAAGVASIAQYRNIQLHSVKATVEGDMDMQGILGIDADVRNGYSGVRVSFDIDADATQDEIEALVAQSQKRSAVFDILANPTAVNVTVASSKNSAKK